jgi:hypothetical protein
MSKHAILLIALILLASYCLCSVEPATSSSNEAENSWVSKASMPTSRGFLGVASANGKIYAMGGQGGGATEGYDPATNNWTTKALMPIPEASFAVAAFEGKIYCIGGLPTPAEGRNQVYDPATDTWDTKAPMPVARTKLQANVVEDKIYLIGGYNPDRPYNTGYELVNTTYVYDTASDTWTTKTPMPIMVPSVSAAIDDKIYCVNSNITQIYDTETDEWSTAAPPPKGLSGETISAIAIAATTGTVAPRLIYVYDGSYLQAYNPVNNSWTLGANPPRNRQYGAMTNLNDTLYLIGGDTWPAPLELLNTLYNDNDRYIPFGYGTVEPVQPPAFPTVPVSVVSGVLIAAVAVGFLVYFKKRKR